jgi:hypothetical protein
MERWVTSTIQTWLQKPKNFLEVVYQTPLHCPIFCLYAPRIHVCCGIRPIKPFGRPRLKSSKYAPHIDGSTTAKCIGWRLHVIHSSDYQMRTASLARDHHWHRRNVCRMGTVPLSAAPGEVMRQMGHDASCTCTTGMAVLLWRICVPSRIPKENGTY